MDNTYVYVAGASSRARTTKEYLESLFTDLKVKAFLVSPEMDDNPEEVCGIPVLKIVGNGSDDHRIDTGLRVYIGTRGVNHAKLTMELLDAGFSKELVIPVTPSFDMELRNKYVKKIFEKNNKEFIKLSDLKMKADSSIVVCDDCYNDARIYVAKTVYDVNFSEEVSLKDYEFILQAGSRISDKRLPEASFFDDEVQNESGELLQISERNKQFCELTAVYWIWKNAYEQIVGIEHWRRRFILPEHWQSIMKNEGIDVILPVPLCVVPSLEDNYKERHIPEIWDETMKIIKMLHPEDYDPAIDYFCKTDIYSPCNMIIAKKQVFDEYCAWLFPVLFELAGRIGIISDKYQSRYPGFISERLLNYYFEKRISNLKIMYADKSFLN